MEAGGSAGTGLSCRNSFQASTLHRFTCRAIPNARVFICWLTPYGFVGLHMLAYPLGFSYVGLSLTLGLSYVGISLTLGLSNVGLCLTLEFSYVGLPLGLGLMFSWLQIFSGCWGLNLHCWPNLQFASVHACLSSVVEHEAIIRQLLHSNHIFPNMTTYCDNPAFWRYCRALSRLSEPYASVVESLRCESYTPSELVRSWLIFARTIEQERNELPPGTVPQRLTLLPGSMPASGLVYNELMYALNYGLGGEEELTEYN